MSEPQWRQELTDETLRHELDRLHPERKVMRPRDLKGLQGAFDAVGQMWEPTVVRAQKLPAPMLQERVKGEFSFVETLRHLLFAWDNWITRMVFGVPEGYHPLGVPPTGALPPQGGGRDLTVDLAPVLEARTEKFATLGRYLSTATDSDLQTVASPPDKTGFPQTDYPVIYCFRVVLNEEWWHHQFAVRDLAVVESGLV